MKLLTFSSLYPDLSRPRHGIFVETRLRQLIAAGGVEARVVAPVPWFPFTASSFGEYGAYARVSRTETRHGIPVIYPRFPIIPKIGMTISPLLMALTMWPVLKRVLDDGYTFDLIDAHYFYPDGVAATLLGKWLNKPVVITARGSDINLVARYALPRRMIRKTALACAGVITVSQALKTAIVALGVDPNRVTVLRNGVDLSLFKPVDRDETRGKLGLDSPTLLSVGNLVEEKGHHLAIEAMAALPDFKLIIIGDGPMRDELAKRTMESGVTARVEFLPALGQSVLRDYYGAADALVLVSSREGMPNVVLEALACGTPIVATRVGGIPEVITTPQAGVLLEQLSTSALVKAITKLFADYPDHAWIRRYAEQFSWQHTLAGYRDLIRQVIPEVAPNAATACAVGGINAKNV